MAIISGTVTQEGVAADGRIVRLHSRLTGALLDETTTSITGAYTLDSGVVPLSDAFVIALPIQEELEEPSYNAEVLTF